VAECGTLAGYSAGCRCYRCRGAIAAYRRERRAGGADLRQSSAALDIPEPAAPNPTRSRTTGYSSSPSPQSVPSVPPAARARPASAFSRPALVPNTRQARRPMFGARPIARAPARPTADGWTDELATAYRLYLAGAGPSPSLLALEAEVVDYYRAAEDRPPF